MKKYQIVEVCGSDNQHAGSKATSDIFKIAEPLGFEPVYIKQGLPKSGLLVKLVNQWHYYSNWKQAFHSIQAGSLLLLQHPFHHRQLGREKFLRRLKEEKQVRFICLVHDVEELRNVSYLNNDQHKKEFDFMLELADQLIVHNQAMKDFFLSKGLPEGRLVVLGIFDYLTELEPDEARFSKSVTIAGNLSPYKSPYIEKIGELEGISFDLYGPNYVQQDSGEQVCYHGSFPPDQLPSQLKQGFGLVWDGDSIDECNGPFGNYLRYNNPHKLSLYIASGLPVIVWRQAALAGFVEERGLGLVVDSLREISLILAKLDQTTYHTYAQNCLSLSQELRSGLYSQNALDQAQARISQ
ncbi:sugar transferase [Streptococcus sobrinus]|uniref:sugar transferase n=1 Tax=Streptococcus sobrinus TaxID=1310 RepID=UPI0002DFBD2F|nr:sugar transferase [Streptococcus sobrinus]